MKPLATPHAPAPASVRPVPPLVPASPPWPRRDVFCGVEPLASLRRPAGAAASLAG